MVTEPEDLAAFLMTITSRIKEIVNQTLAPVGVEVSSTLAKQIESQRLERLQQKEHWESARYARGLRINTALSLQFLRDECGPFSKDYDSLPRTAQDSEDSFYLENGWFESVDAELLYSMIRGRSPQHILEIGSGYSTRLMRRAINDGHLMTKVISVDPNPNTVISPFADEYLRKPVEDLDFDQILGPLQANDILFIDSSHRIQTGGDVPYLFLEILPQLPQGVYVHVHDIFLPFDYPKEWVLDSWGWTEQYLVHAFLMFNDAFEILWPARYMWEHEREAIVDVIPSAAVMNREPSSLWLRKVT